MPNFLKSALVDLHATFRMRRVWLALAGEDVGDQHRRTTLGPVWLLLNYLAFAGTFIFVFHRGGTGEGINYAAYAATGLMVWFYIMEVINQSVVLFVREESFIKGTTLPMSLYVMRMAMQSAIRAVYALVGCLAILFLSGADIAPAWIYSLLAIFLILLTTPAVVTVVAFIGAYFPDSQFLVQNLMRIGMFITPVFWSYDGSGGVRHILYSYNPFTYFLEIVRVPILYGDLPARALLFCICAALLTWLLALFLLGRYRKEVVFVL